MKTIKLSPILFFVCLSFASTAQEIATTESGRKVILYSDHTWKYYEIQKKQSEPKRHSLPKKSGYESNKNEMNNDSAIELLSLTSKKPNSKHYEKKISILGFDRMNWIANTSNSSQRVINLKMIADVSPDSFEHFFLHTIRLRLPLTHQLLF